MEMNGIPGEEDTFVLLDKINTLVALEVKCVMGATHQGGRVSLGPERSIRIMFYAQPANEYESMLRAGGNGTAGGAVSRPGQGRGITGGSV